jgi:hypothetical protein
MKLNKLTKFLLIILEIVVVIGALWVILVVVEKCRSKTGFIQNTIENKYVYDYSKQKSYHNGNIYL